LVINLKVYCRGISREALCITVLCVLRLRRLNLMTRQYTPTRRIIVRIHGPPPPRSQCTFTGPFIGPAEESLSPPVPRRPLPFFADDPPSDPLAHLRGRASKRVRGLSTCGSCAPTANDFRPDAGRRRPARCRMILRRREVPILTRRSILLEASLLTWPSNSRFHGILYPPADRLAPFYFPPMPLSLSLSHFRHRHLRGGFFYSPLCSRRFTDAIGRIAREKVLDSPNSE
jgi:hypothetical protein